MKTFCPSLINYFAYFQLKKKKNRPLIEITTILSLKLYQARAFTEYF